ncbi:MAG TPA: metalloregulator ArsR/SmtB family transcription factor [Casimicrobiaceae bacterium]|jgi:DNA-binding transcriptional ArsR family regulator|nr:metalloregulator ArsR/SmtB family transcription factor [Casimicrobiaceae bacterium]
MDSRSTLRALAALAQDTRLAIFRLLVEHGREGLTPGRIAGALDLPGATLSFHLKELANAGLIRARQESRFIHYSAVFEAMNGLVAYLTENCCGASGSCEPGCARDCNPKEMPRRAATPAVATQRRVA